MKRLLSILFVIAVSCTLYAQSDSPSDSIGISLGPTEQFGEFLIDMNLLKTPVLPPVTNEFMLGPDIRNYYQNFYIPDQRWIFTQGSLPMTFSTSNLYGMGWNTPMQLQMGTFHINDNLRLNLYGEYDPEGYKVPNRNALPWERNNFVGGMELKGKDFSIRIDVRRGHHPGFPY